MALKFFLIVFFKLNFEILFQIVFFFENDIFVGIVL